jgi:hypothetical protein
MNKGLNSKKMPMSHDKSEAASFFAGSESHSYMSSNLSYKWTIVGLSRLPGTIRSYLLEQPK